VSVARLGAPRGARSGVQFVLGVAAVACHQRLWVPAVELWTGGEVGNETVIARFSNVKENFEFNAKTIQ
jgi:hypothetical protein